MVNYKRYVKKTAQKAVKVAKSKIKKRYYTKGKANTKQMYNDIMLLKSIVNAEKKQISVSPGATLIGQVNGNAEGALVLDVTPQPAQGTGDSQRSGDSIKICTAMFKFQIAQQTGSQPIRGIIELYKVLGTPQATTDFISRRFLPNAFITSHDIRDLNAMPDQDYRQQYQLVASRKFYLKGDTASSQVQYTNVHMPINLGMGHHVKYQENTTNVASGQLLLCVRCDNGNFSASTVSTATNVLTTAINTGAYFLKSMTFYYYDN